MDHQEILLFVLGLSSNIVRKSESERDSSFPSPLLQLVLIVLTRKQGNSDAAVKRPINPFIDPGCSDGFLTVLESAG